MKIANGTDIIEISRIKKSIENLGNKFLQTIYTQGEIEYCEGHRANKFQHYAGRFAVKEALYKALCGILPRENLSWKSFEVLNDDCGRPFVNIEDEKILSISVSISHCKEYAIANVVVLYDE